MLYVIDSGCADNGMVNFRLRLSDSTDSFSGSNFFFLCNFLFIYLSGFVCKTKIPEQLKPGVLICIEAFNVESLGDNKYVLLGFLSQTVIRFDHLLGLCAKLSA